ncbi:DUF4956 domain-containing protein [Planctellipticum variicoloris]|uniref:DUF4956 domain-containing protein n=1 Tax=Planctellipticum variicoloris TaxID=3064265 RepID=UPI003013D782|nr:DUF4956 domain-containing protein [Planctomycetaceae bacterium SH412]
MPKWLSLSMDSTSSVTWPTLTVRLMPAIAFGLIVAEIYRRTRGASRIAASFPGTLVLLCVLIAMVTQVIGDNVARAFSLVGALSIVRFRTVVQDTKDTAFVIFAVAVGMAIGAGQPAVALGGTVAVGFAAWLLRDLPRRNDGLATHPFELDIRLGWSPEVESLLKATLARHARHVEAIGAGTAKQGAALNLQYRLRIPHDASLSALIADLNAIAGVQAVELRQPRSDG